MQFNLSELEISDAINESVEQILTTDSEHRVEIVGVVDVTLNADRHRLELVIINFLANAVKYSPEAELIKTS